MDRGVLFHRLGDYEAALRDYDAAINWSPPYAKPYFNRALTLVALGRTDEAYGDYDRVLALEPDYIEARSRGPGSARLLFLRGLLELQRNEPDAALRSFTAAIEADPGLADAWANRATIFFQRRDLDAALRDLTRALGLRNDANLRYNRGRVFEAQQMWDDAAKDYELALTMVRGDSRHIIRHLRTCRRAMLASRATTEPLVKLEKSTPRAW